MWLKYIGALILIVGLSACAVTSAKKEIVEAPISKQEQLEAQKQVALPEAKFYKRKIAIIRFTNETNYGRTLLTDQQYDRIGKQASDLLASRLIKSGKFLVFERTDLAKLQKERKISLGTDSGLMGVGTVITGSVSEFGRSTGGKTGLFSSTKVQTAKAKVDIRLIDVKTGYAFYSAIGAGQASTESGKVAVFGSKADYDATLNDRAIAAAISDVIDKLVSTLEERPWRTDVLQVKGSQVFISGGKAQGLKVGDQLQVMEPGEKVQSRQSGFDILLPSKKVATIKVVSFFGDNETNEGSLCELISGNIPDSKIKELFVVEGDKI